MKDCRLALSGFILDGVQMDLMTALRYLQQEGGMTREEANQYLKSLPRESEEETEKV